MKNKDKRLAKLREEGKKKAEKYLCVHGEFEAYNAFGGKTIADGVRRMRRFYQIYPGAPV